MNAKKPTYEELERRLSGLEAELAKRKRVEKALRKSEEELRTFMDSITDFFAVTDKDESLVYVNKSMAEMLGYSQEEMLGMHVSQVISEESIANFLPEVKELVDKGRLSTEATWITKHGEKVYGELNVNAIYDADGNYMGSRGVFRDITDRKRAEEALKRAHDDLERLVAERTAEIVKRNEELRREIQERGQVEEALKESVRRMQIAYDQSTIYAEELKREIAERKRGANALRASEEKYRSLVESTEDSVYLTDSYCTYLFMNEKHLSRFGLPKDEVIGKSYGDFHSQEDTKGFAEKVNKVVKTGRSLWHEHRSQRDGRHFLRTLSPVKGPEGKTTAVTVVSKEITELKHLETQLQHAQRMKAIGTLAGGIAHDFNNVLMAIQGHTSLMSIDTGPEHPYFEHLKGIEATIQRGASLARQLLGFARGGKYEAKPTDLNELIEQSCQMFGRTQKEIEIHTKYQKEIWPVEVDRAQIEQVLLNLYVNAWQAMPHGGNLYVETSHAEMDENRAEPFEIEPGHYVRISVTDTGTGMDKATQQRIFDPFFTTKEMGRGTGLGLASAYGIIKNHGGIINVYSEKGKGSTFNIYLPASEKGVAVAVSQPVEEILKGTGTVLLVDDENMVLGVGKEMLERIGYRVLLATGGREAVEIHRRHKDDVDLVILDMIMPDMGGGETFDRMREDNPNVKVLLSSGYSINGQATEILQRGCDGFIQKPFHLKELSGKIREILDKP
jgi:PAS domain S-box-containing protein